MMLLNLISRRCMSSLGPAAATRPPLQLFGVPGRYAHALFGAANESNVVEKVNNELAAIVNVAKSYEPFTDFLKDPTIGRNEKQQAIQKMLGDKVEVTTSRFFQLLAQNNRLGDLTPIASAFSELVDAYSGKVSAMVTSAKPMNESELKALSTSLQKYLKKGETLSITTKTDPSILGGLIVQMGDKSMDLSVAARIKTIRTTIKEFSA